LVPLPGNVKALIQKTCGDQIRTADGKSPLQAAMDPDLGISNKRRAMAK